MLDWPGRLATTVFVSGCPLACPFCHNAHLLKAREGRREDLDALLGHLHDRADWLEGVVVSGGEPTADPGLPGLLRSIKSLGMPVRLDTNGTRPDLLEGLIADGLVDCIALDVKATPERYDAASGRRDMWPTIERSIAVVFGSGLDHEFRTTVCPGITEPPDLPLIAERLEGGISYAIQQFRPERTLDPALATAQPPAPSALRHAADACSAYLPTNVRGA